ncbi:TFIIB-type zinc ribbon-containing protein [Actinokineospora sp.]|uniref:TFIIB-type zinc ribbon-containing protein n=1 Tax=Actinokineospora sp. TaxID=1872133 RepID=UPI004037FD3E
MGSGSSDLPSRFRDQQVIAWSFLSDADEVLVHCPRCDACAKVVARPADPPSRSGFFGRRRLSCAACGHVTDEVAGERKSRYGHEWVGTVRDPYFQCRLWLQADCCGQVLWAFNLRHLDYLRSYVAADLRERSHPRTGWHRRMTMVAKLPAWLKSAKNRSEVLRGLDRLRATT